MSKRFKLSFIGAGNVSWHLSSAFENAGFKVQEVFSRNLKNAKEVTSLLYDATPVDKLDFSKSESEVFIICVSDDKVQEVSNELIVPDGSIVVHTSGSGELNLLNKHPLIGVLYPLQTFTKGNKILYSEIPFFFEASDEVVTEKLQFLATALSGKVYQVDSSARMALHIAAVFASNFSNHLYAISNEIIERTGIPFDVLKPLVEETAYKAFNKGPLAAQTGPAIRKDVKILEKHINFLTSDPEMKSLYKILSHDILKKAE